MQLVIVEQNRTEVLLHVNYTVSILFLSSIILHIRGYVRSSRPYYNPISGHYRSASETPFGWRFAGGPIVARFYVITGLIHVVNLFVC